MPVAVRELLLALAQVAAVFVPLAVAIVLAVQQRWRRLVLVAAAGVAASAIFVIADRRLDLAGGLPDAVDSGTWLAAPDFPSLPFIAGLAAAAMVGKPWMSRPWRRATDLAVAVLVGAVAIAGTLGVLEAPAGGGARARSGAALLTLFGAPNRRPAGPRWRVPSKRPG